jgi:4-diphosphocytidyl-2-C-methyl-D-erythritol kinase
MSRARAYAKLNLALVVGPLRPDGKHEVATVLQAIDLHDDVELEPADDLAVEGFAEDTLVRAALAALADAADVEPRWRVRIEKRIPVAAGLGGGSTDAAAALQLANALLPEPLPADTLHAVAAGLGADVPFFLRDAPQLGTGDGSELAPVELPTDYAVVLVLPENERKASTAEVYEQFDRRAGADGFEGRRADLLAALERLGRPQDLAGLPRNDLASAPLAAELLELGAFRADVTGAGPAVYGLFAGDDGATAARNALTREGRTWLARPVARRRARMAR